MQRNLRFFYVTGKKENLEKIAKVLLENKSAISVNLIKTNELYYKDRIIEEEKYVSIVKVVVQSAEHCKEVFDKIEELHEDENPVILELAPVGYINDKAKTYYNKEGYNITTP